MNNMSILIKHRYAETVLWFCQTPPKEQMRSGDVEQLIPDSFSHRDASHKLLRAWPTFLSLGDLFNRCVHTSLNKPTCQGNAPFWSNILDVKLPRVTA